MDTDQLSKGTIYIASSVGTYESEKYSDIIEKIGNLFPEFSITPAKYLYQDLQQWKDCWPDHLESITGLAFFSDDRGFIGAGVVKEAVDTHSKNKPVWYWKENQLIPHDGFRLVAIQPNPSQYARVELCDSSLSFSAKPPRRPPETFPRRRTR